MTLLNLRTLPLTLADIKSDETMVTVWCLVCQRHQTMLVYLLRQMVGPVAFGTINGRFTCRGCSSRFGVVLPPQAPTPEAWARAYRPKAGDRVADLDMPPNYFPFHIEQWEGDSGRVDRYMGQVTEHEAAMHVFDIAVEKMKDRFGNPYVTIRHQGRVLRDSRRDFKLLPGGKDQD